MSRTKLLSTTALKGAPRSQLARTREDAIEHIERGNAQFAIRVLINAFADPEKAYWTAQKKRAALRSVWNAIEEQCRLAFFNMAVDALADTGASKDREYKVRQNNRSKYFDHKPSLRRLTGELMNQILSEFEGEFEFMLALGKNSALVDLMCTGKMQITEGNLKLLQDI